MNNIYTQGAVVAIIGLCTVFLVLAILWCVLEIMRVVFTKNQTVTTIPASTAKIPTPAPVATATTIASTEDDSELVAVLMAAIAASLNQNTTYNLKIKSYRQVDAGTPIWNKTARRDNVVG